MQTIVAGLIAVGVGAVYSAFGYRLFRFLLPLWGFLVGLGLGGSVVQAFNGGFFTTTTGWIVGIVAGLVLAGLAVYFYKLGIAIFGASIGYGLVSFLAQAAGMRSGFVLYTIALLGAVLIGYLVYRMKMDKIFISIFTAAAGATGIISGVLVWFGRLDVNSLGSPDVLQPILATSWFWLLIWVIVAGAGVVLQMRTPTK